MAHDDRSDDPAVALARAEAEAAEIRRSAEADADLLRAQADRYAAQRRREADQLRDQAERQFVLAQERALALKADAEREAAAIVRSAEHRARVESSEILEQARRQLGRMVDGARPTRRLPIVSGTLTSRGRAGGEIIDLRHDEPEPEPEGAVDPERGVAAPEERAPAPPRRVVAVTDADPLDALVGEAVTNAVRQAIDPSPVRAGRRR